MKHLTLKFLILPLLLVVSSVSFAETASRAASPAMSQPLVIKYVYNTKTGPLAPFPNLAKVAYAMSPTAVVAEKKSEGFMSWASSMVEKAVEKAKEKIQNFSQPSVAGSGTGSNSRGVAGVDSGKEEPQINVEEKNQLVKQLPSFSLSAAQTKQNKDLIAAQVAKAKTFTPTEVVEKGRAADSKLDKTKSGVAYVPKAKLILMAEVPALDIGREDKVKAADFTYTGAKLQEIEMKKVTPLASLDVMSEAKLKEALGAALMLVDDSSKMQVIQRGEKTVTLEMVNKVIYQLAINTQVIEKEFKPFTAEELKALAAMMLYEYGDKCHIITGMFYDLTKSKDEKLQGLANFYLGACSHKMGMYSESTSRLIKVLKMKTSPYAVEAAEALLEQDVPYEFEVEVGKTLAEYMSVDKLNAKFHPVYHYVVAKANVRTGKWADAIASSEKVPSSHKLYAKAQYIMAVGEYSMGQTSKSLERQEKLYDLVKNTNDKELTAIIAVNLARTSFQSHKYKSAIENFLKIGRDHPLWVQGLQEQAWAQLMASDPAGAIGNMHSIQSPYFRSVYMPESFAISAVGYLNLCQYGDAYRSLVTLEKQYRPWYDVMNNFVKTNPESARYYKSVVKYLSSPSSQSVEGVPATILREMARHKDFLNLQQAVNNRFDEEEQYKFIDSLIVKEKSKIQILLSRTDTRVSKVEQKQAQAKRDVAADTGATFDLDTQKKVDRDLAEYYRFQISLFDQSRANFADYKKVATTQVQALRERLQAQAGKSLKDRMQKMITQLGNILENSELLRYEVFSGSGENLRYHVTATGKGEKRIPATEKPKTKELQWSFDGEFWEDEIGHYRSSLKNNCPNS